MAHEKSSSIRERSVLHTYDHKLCEGQAQRVGTFDRNSNANVFEKNERESFMELRTKCSDNGESYNCSRTDFDPEVGSG